MKYSFTSHECTLKDPHTLVCTNFKQYYLALSPLTTKGVFIILPSIQDS